MRLDQPRLPPLNDAELNPAQAEIIAGFKARGADYNIFRTFVRDPGALRAFMVWGSHILSNDNPLGPRRRELAILRTGFLCKAGYEWAQHVRIGQQAGLTDAEIAGLKQGPLSDCWDAADRALLMATDQLVADHFIADAAWAALAGHFSEGEVLALIFTVGQYTMVSMFLNSAGVQLDPGLVADPDLSR
jgi:alkylhydroperoxidase family enzyme